MIVHPVNYDIITTRMWLTKNNAMFDNIYKNGKFLPFGEEKLKSRLTEEDKALLTDGIDFKLNVFQIMEGIDINDLKCAVCGNFISLKTAKKRVFPATCSKSCAGIFFADKRIQSRDTNFGGKEKYKKYLSELQHKNSLEKYGTTHQKISRNKNRKTLIERYGVTHNSQLESVKEARKVIENGKSVDILHSRKSREKSKKTKLNWTEEYKASLYSSIGKSIKNNGHINHDILDKINYKISIEELQQLANCSRMTAYRALSSKGLIDVHYTQSSIEQFILDLGFDCVETRKIIPPYELDIYIPEKKLAIEYDGIYWHSSGSKETDKIKETYHLMKTEMCEAQGIQLLHIFENEWIDDTKREIWKSIIKHKLGLSERIPARKCKARFVNKDEAKEFINKNHLQGFCSGAHTYKGLYYNNELVQIISIGKSRYSSGDELLRMCSKLGVCVVGGASKLLKGINCLSYGNRRWCSTLSNVYDSVMEFSHISEPCYWYVDKGEVFHRSSYMKHKLKNKLKNYDDTITEVENCYANGLRRIWDCGNLVYRTK